MVDRIAEEKRLTAVVQAAVFRWLAAVRDAVREAFLKLSGRVDIHAVAATQPLWDSLVGDLSKDLLAVAQQEYEAVGRGLDADETALIQQVVAASRRNLATLPGEVQNELSHVITSSVDAGKTPAQIEAAIDEFLSDTGSPNWPNRAKVIAVTEVHRMANAATYAAGVVTSGMQQQAMEKIWDSRDDDRTRPDHAAADGQVVPLNAMFQVGDSLMLYPGAPGAPAKQVVNCRCKMKIRKAS